MSRCVRILVLLIGLFVLAVFVFLLGFSVSAVPEPGRAETYIAGVLRHTLVRIASRRATLPQPPADRKASIEQGDKLFGTECADCHGLDGKTPTDEGRWMYPRAANLTSPEAQQYSDRELFWVVKNGIRLSGMPAFAPVETDEHIWNLVEFVRTLPQPQSAQWHP